MTAERLRVVSRLHRRTTSGRCKRASVRQGTSDGDRTTGREARGQACVNARRETGDRSEEAVVEEKTPMAGDRVNRVRRVAATAGRRAAMSHTLAVGR
jgi:hypothetical protein